MNTTNQNTSRRIQRWHLWVLFAVLLLPLERLHAQQDRVAALKQSLAENQKRLQQYQWVETTIVSLKGEEKSRVQELCSYGPESKVQKQQISAPPQQQPSGGRLKKKIIAKKKEELSDYMKQAVELVHEYAPPSPQRIQAGTYLESAKDSITLDARFAALNDGVNVANAVLVAAEKKIQVVIQNSDYRRIAAATAPSKPGQ